FLDANWGFWNDDDSGTNGAWGWNPDENDGYPFLKYQGFVDVTFPVVENKVPENDETGVEVNTVITLEFNQDVNEVDLDEVQITNTDTGPVSGLTITLDGNKLALEDAELEEFTLYSISIPEGTVKSNYDIENQEVNWDFTTIRTAPVAVNESPSDGSDRIALDADITVEFDQEVNEVNLDDVLITDPTDKPLSNVEAALEGYELTITHANFENFTDYTVSIPVGTVKNNDDIENEAFSWDFTTIRTAPVAVNESPSDGSDRIALDADITVEFDQEVNEVNLDDIAITDTDNNTARDVVATLNDNELIISHADLTNFTEYTVTIPEGALENEDKIENLAHSWSFTTAMAAPVSIKETPKDEATDIKLDTKISVTLDQQVTAVDVSGGFITDDRGDTLAGMELMVEGQEIIITHSELDNATRYSVFIPAGVAMNEDEILNEPYTWSFTTVHATPPVVMLTYPQDEVLDIGQLPKFIWKEADHATEYHLQVASDADFNELLIDELELEAHTFMPENELNRQQVYYWRVRAINAGGAGGWPDAYRFETSPAPPPQVILGAPVDSAGAITLLPNLSWEAASGADNYRLELAADADFNKLILAVDEIGATEYSMDEELDYYGIYHWRVQAINSGGIGKWSQGGVFITEAKVPEPQFPADHADNMSIAPEISWSSPYEELNYDLRLSTKVDLNEGAEEYVTTGTKLQVSGLQTNTKYYWQVRLSDELTQSGWSESSSFTTRNNLQAETLPVSFDFTLQESGQIDPVDYQMIGLPGHHKAYMDEVLEGDYSEVWRAFSDTGGEDDFLLEYDSKSNRLAFGPGFGFWAFYRDSLNLDLNYIPVPLDEHDTFAIDIQPGWNIIANPFASMVAWSEVQAFNEIDGDLFSYNKLFEEAHTLMPYVGYYFYNKPRWGLKKLEIPYGNPDKRRSMINTGPDRIAYKAQESRDDSRQLRLKALFKTESGELAAHTDVTWNYKPDYSAAQYPSLEMSRYGMVFPDEIPDGITRSIGANYKETGTAYDLTVKAPVGRTMHWEADFQSLSDQARVLLVNPASHQSRLLANGDIIEMIVSEPEVSYQVHIGHEAYLQEIQENLLPDEITLRQNYPNPFNPSTNITYALIEDVEMRLDVYDILGRRVQTLVQGYQEQGWYTVPFDGLGLSSGVYIYRLVSGQHILTEKMMLIK
ncbi:MAG: Ig-like domain-containing protein, partial [Balneolales bacterium]